MKKTNGIVTLVFAALTVVAAALHLILTSDPDLVYWIMAILVAAAAVGMWVIPSFAQNKLLAVIPVLGLLALGEYIKFLLTAMGAQLSEITDVLPTYFQYETLHLMLTGAFVVAMVFALKKGYKWALTVSLVYSSVMLVCQVQLFLTYAFSVSALSFLGADEKKAMVGLMLLPFAFVTAYAAQVAMFTGLDTAEKEEPLPSVGTPLTANDSKQE